MKQRRPPTDTPIVLADEDWQSQQHASHFQTIHCNHPQVTSLVEAYTFRPGFRLVRQTLNSRQPTWQPPFSDTGYIGFCFAFCAADPKTLALSHLFHQRMNITSGYRFDGGVNRVIDTPLTYVALQFSRDFLQQLNDEQRLPSWLANLTKESGIIDTLTIPHRLRERAWQLGCLPPTKTLSQRLHIEALSLDWLADSLLLDSQPVASVRIDEAVDIIRRDYQDTLTISQLAQQIGTNACYLKKQFKEQTGMTINAFITHTRLQMAEKLLRDRPELSIKMVAALCGYQASYFTALFKKHHGITPKQWQKIG